MQKTDQRLRQRLYEHRPAEIEVRLKQQKPKVTIERQSQRLRRQLLDLKPNANTDRRRALRMASRSESVTPSSTDAIRQAVLDAVNAERKRAGKTLLTQNMLLQTSAQAYAEDMLQRNFFSHTSPGGEEPFERMQAAGYGDLTSENCNCKHFSAAFGENLAKGQQSVTEVIDDWMASPTHRDNILSDAFLELGIGIAGDLWVQHFGAIKIDPR